MILGVGVDIVDVARMDAALARRGRALARRLLSDQEFCEFEALAPGGRARFLAKRFAVREAAAKALGVGVGRGLRWRDFIVTHDARGAPRLRFERAARRRALDMGARAVHISIADERGMAAAFAVLDGSGAKISL